MNSTKPDSHRTERIGNQTLILADCREVLPTIEAGSVALCLTSPPYNIGKEYDRNLTWQDYLQWQDAVFAEAARTCTSAGSICWQVGNHVEDGAVEPLDCELYAAFKHHGLPLRNRIVWTFGHGLHCTRRFSGRHETVLWYTKSDLYTFNLDPVRVPQKYPGKRHFKGPHKGELSCNPLGANPGDVWEIPNVKHNHPEKTAHPCQFPEALASRLILSLTNVGDGVLDPFMGSGTTLAAAEQSGRTGIGIELDPVYFEIACQRVEAAIRNRQSVLFDLKAGA